MALKRTTWRPDTCGCQFTYEWDTDVAEAERTHTVTGMKACALHAKAEAPEAFAAVLAENQGKNKAIAALLEHAPDLKAGDIGFRFDEQRRLRLSAPALGARRAAARAALAAKGFADVELE